MKYYLIKNSKDIYSILQNGLGEGNIVYSIDSIDEIFEEACEKYTPCIFEIDSSNVNSFSNFTLTANVLPNDMKVIPPKELGITDAASHMVYNLYSANNNFIHNRINKIVENLKESNKDLSDYLKLANKLSFKKENDIKIFAQTFEFNINDSLEHASQIFDKDFNKEDFDYKHYPDFFVKDLYNYDNINSWAEWKKGELSELDEEELKQEVANFRPKVLDWIENKTCPPIIIIDDGDTIIGDGRGRVSLAVGLNWDKIPVIIATSKNKKSNSYNRMIKLASILDLGNPNLAGKSLGDIVLFLLRRIPKEERSKAISSMISKIRNINVQDVSSKNMGDYSSMGQSLTFIKNVLTGHEEEYVKKVLDSIIRNLS